MNKEVARRLKKEVNGSYNKWSLALPVVQLALSIQPNSRIKSSAFEVVHGRPFNGFLDFQGVQETQELQELIAK